MSPLMSIEVGEAFIRFACTFVGDISIQLEGGQALIVSLLGYPAQLGFVVGLLRHAKEMFWVLAGLLCLAHHRAALRSTTEPVAARGEYQLVTGPPISRSSLEDATHARCQGS